MTDEDRIAQALHERAMRDEPLTAEEQSRLDAWFARMDEQERIALSRATDEPNENAALRSQIDASLEAIQLATRRNRALSAENDALRSAIALLEQRLARSARPQPA